MYKTSSRVITDKIGNFHVYFVSPTEVVAIYALNDNDKVSASFRYLGKGMTVVQNIRRLTALDCSLIQEFILLNYKDILKHSGF